MRQRLCCAVGSVRLGELRDRLLLLDKMKQSSDQNLERERANGENVAILSDMLKECENTNRRLETQLKFANDELHSDALCTTLLTSEHGAR